MADIQSNINLNINTAAAMAEIKNLQRTISVFHSTLAKGSATAAAKSASMQQNLLNSINKTGQFSAQMTTVKTTTESFTNALEKNKLSMGEYFRYAGASTKTFGRMFRSEFETINKVARERVKDLQTQYIKMGRDANGAMKAIAVRPVALDMQNLGTQTQMAAQRQMIFNQLLRQGSTNLLNFGKNTQWAGRQLMVGFTIPLTIFGSVAAKEFMKLEEQAIKFKRVYGDMFTTSGETEKALDNIRELASEFTKYGVAVESTIELAAKVAQMGNVGEALESQVREATRLSVLGGIDQQEALETTTSLTNAFGIATEDLTDKINFLNAAENQTILSIEDFNTAIPLAGSVVQSLGGNVEDLAFFLTAMREGGINASQGANALKSSLARLINPSSAARDRLSEMGIDVLGIVEANAGNLRGTVVGLASALDTLAPLERARAIEQLFGKYQFARMSTMLSNITKEGSQANKVLQLTGSSTQELGILAERELGKVENSVTFKFKKSVEDFLVSLAPIGEAFLKAVTPIIEFGTKILDKFNELGDGTKQFLVIAGAGLGVIGPVALMTFGLIANGAANVIKFFALLGGGYQKLTGQNASLGLSTEYMTKEQLEASAVAASLNQSHSKLIQTFTLEAGAIDRLAAAYRGATASQRNFAGPVVAGGKAVRPKKLANGILSVPGPRGAGDVVPAMLSPGEAVIPAKQANKYAGFINSIMQDNLPGYRFGFNPFAAMLGRARVAARMPQSSLMSMISQGSEARYSNAFKTQTGADYLHKGGSRNPRQEALRSRMEEGVFGISPSAGADARPTYGYARISPIQALLNRIFGLKGKQFNAVTFNKRIGDIGKKGLIRNREGKWIYDPRFKEDDLGRYGDVDIVTKRSVSRRSTAVAGDALVDYRDSQQYGPKKPYFAPAPMRGATQGQIEEAMFDSRIGKRFGRYKPDPINHPNMFGYNPQLGYIETHTPGGFGVNEISRIIAKDKAAKKAIQEALSASGLKIRVTDQNFATKLFKTLGIPGFEDGIFSVPGPRGAGDVVPAMLSPGEAVIPADKAKKYSGFINSMISGNIPGFKSGYSYPGNKTVRDHVVELRGKEAGAAELARANAAAAATEKELLKMRKEGVKIADSQIAAAKQLDRAHRVQVAGLDKKDPSLWNKPGMWNVRTGGENNLIGDTVRKSTRNQKVLEEYLKKTGATANQTQSILEKTQKGIALNNKEASVQGKALRAIGKDFGDGKISKNMISETFGKYARAVGAGQLAADKIPSKDWTPAQKRAADAHVDSLRATTTANQKVAKTTNKTAEEIKKQGTAVKASTSATKTTTRTPAKPTQTSVAASERSRKGWETRKANQAARQAAPIGDPDSPGARRGIGAGGVMGVAAVGAMGASFVPGKVGAVAQQLMLPLMMLPMILPLLKSPIVLAVAAVAALGAGIFMLYKKLKDATKAGIETANTMSMTTEKIKSISQVTGTIGATELRQKQQESQINRGGPEFSSFGLGFLQDSEQGKAMLQDVEKQLESGRTMDEVGANIGRQLAMAISQGVLSVDQASSIASALGAELGDYSISMDISGKLTELLGIDGTDLMKDPLTVAIRIKEDSMKEQAEVFEQAMSAMTYGKDNPLAVGLLSAAAATATAGTILAAASIGPQGAATLPAALISGGVSAALATGAGIVNWTDRQKDNKLAGAALQLGVEQLAQNQMLVDSINGQYDTQVNQLKTQLLTVQTEEQRLAIQKEINKLEESRRGAIVGINEANAETTAQILAQAKSLDDINLYDSAIAESVRQRYSEGPMKTFADEALEQLKNMEDQDFAMSLNLQMATGELSPIAVLKLIEAGANNENLRASFTLGMNTQGSAQMNQLMQLLAQTGMGDARFAIMLDFIVNKEGQDFNDALEALAIITSAESRYPIDIDIETSNGEDVLAGVMTNLEKYRDMPDTMTKQAFIDIAQGDAALTDIVNRWDELGLTNDIYRQFVIDFLTLDANADPKLVAAYMSEQNISSSRRNVRRGGGALTAMGGTGMESNMPTAEDVAKYGQDAVNWAMAKRAEVLTQFNEADSDSDTEDSGGGGTPSSVLDNLLKKLRDVRDATIGVAKGWDAARASLDSLFAGGNTLTMFSGLEQKMRGFNLGEDIISLIVGMDPDEFEKRKRELFTFDSKGNITGITTALRNMALAMKSMAMGDFQNEQQKTLRTYNEQLTAIQKLVAAGMTHAAAYEAVQDTAFASAIAQERNNQTIRNTVKDANAAAKALKDFAAAQGLVSANEDFSQRGKILDFLTANQGKFTNAQVEAILRDTNLQRLLLTPGVDANAVNTALQNAVNVAQLELDFKKLTISGMEEIFNDGFSKAMEKFSAMEQEIELDFNLKTEGDRGLVEEAQRQIQAIEYEIDDLDADLFRISEIERGINEDYDERVEALEKVSAINSRIAKQQKSQLSIADALSQGDIAAAARAMAEYRQEQAQDAIEERKRSLEEQRQNALNGVVGKTGKTRLQIEQEIRDLQREVFNIQEESLEPAQRRVELATQEKNDLIESLTVLGRTREEWAKIQNSINLAKTSSDSYTKAIQGAVDIVKDILHYWNELDGKQVTTYHQIVETRVSTPAPATPTGPGIPSDTSGNERRNQAEVTRLNNEITRLQRVISAFGSDRRLYIMPGGPGASAWNAENTKLQNQLRTLQQALARQMALPLAMGGMVDYRRMGGMLPYKAMGGSIFKSINTDSIPAMLTAGEYVVKRSAVQKFGVDNLEKINSGTYNNGSVYNYSLNVNVRSDADPTKIARTVMAQIKQVDAQRIRGNRF